VVGAPIHCRRCAAFAFVAAQAGHIHGCPSITMERECLKLRGKARGYQCRASSHVPLNDAAGAIRGAESKR
jgi:hypothetical protein